MQPGCVSPEHRRRRLLPLAVVIGVALLAAACRPASPASTGETDTAGTVWLCRPGMANDPCAGSLATTVVPPGGARSTVDPAPDAQSPFDCFYVYPTVSTEAGDNSDLTVHPAESDIATAQAAPFSQVCRVWAPMYRQRTESSLLKGLGNDPQADSIAYTSLLAGWKDYLAHYNDGRPIIFIGHSQGAAMLIRLISQQVDPDPSLRARLVVAIIAGGNLAVPTGQAVGATFQHLPLCTASAQTGCVIAYSTFPSEPPASSEFGRPGQGVSLQSGQTASQGVQVACVNPSALGGGSGALDPLFPSATSTPSGPSVTTPFVTYPDLYTAACHSAGGATWLQVTTLGQGANSRPIVSETLGASWGYHLDDINLALGNLVGDVTAEEAAYASAHPS